MWTAIGLTVSAVGNFMMAMPHFVGTGQTYEFDAEEAAKMNDKVPISQEMIATVTTGFADFLSAN